MSDRDRRRERDKMKEIGLNEIGKEVEEVKTINDTAFQQKLTIFLRNKIRQRFIYEIN